METKKEGLATVVSNDNVTLIKLEDLIEYTKRVQTLLQGYCDPGICDFLAYDANRFILLVNPSPVFGQ